MAFNTHSVSPSGSIIEDGELRGENGSRKRRLETDSTAARAPRPHALPESSGRRFEGQPDNRTRIRYADTKDWRSIALEEIDRRRRADNNCDSYDKRAEHFECKSSDLAKQVAEAGHKIQLLETQLREAQGSASTWQQKAERTEQQLQQAGRENKEFESQLIIKEQALIEKTESEQRLRARAAELILQRDQANQTAGMLKSKLNQLQDEYEASKTATAEKISRLQAYQEQQRKSSEETMTALRKEKAQLSRTANTQLTSIQDLRVKCQSSIEEKTAAENKLAVIQQRLEETQHKLAEIQHSLDETQQKLVEEMKMSSGLRNALAMIHAQAGAKLVKQERT